MSEESKLLDLFLEENRDRFQQLNHALLELEERPEDADVLYAILRHVHSLKGSAGMFGFQAVRDLAHRLEDLLTLLHKNPALADRPVMDLLFQGCDRLESLFRRVSDTLEDVEPDSEDIAYEERLRRTVERMGSSSDLQTAARILVDAAKGVLGDACRLEDQNHLREAAARMESVLAGETKSARGGDGPKPDTDGEGAQHFLGDRNVTVELASLRRLLTDAAEQPLSLTEEEDFYRDLAIVLDAAATVENEALAEIVRDADESVDMFRDMHGGFDEMQVDYYRGVLDALNDHVRRTGRLSSGALEGEAPAAAPEGAEKSGSKSVRVDESKIDAFLDGIGEILILSEIYGNLQKRAAAAGSMDASLLREFKTANVGLAQQVLAIQDDLMEIRRVEMRHVFAGLPRLVRDVSHHLGKEARIVLSGEDAVLDKSHLDDLNACLLHIVRNAIDHGLETPDRRDAAGKAATGEISVAAENVDNHLLVRIRDDGRGLNIETLRRKAAESGLCDADALERMDDKDLAEFVFRDGFSTAQSVTELSGRGVGMAAVREGVQRMGGTVSLQFEPGRFTEIALRIPLSVMLSVMEGLVMRAGRQQFVVPVRTVLQSFRPRSVDITSVQGRGECVRLRDELFPLIPIGQLYRIESAPTQAAEGVAVLLEDDGRRGCLLVDEVLDHQQVVIKQIEGLSRLPGVLGGALLGDGSIGFVLDVGHILHRRS